MRTLLVYILRHSRRIQVTLKLEAPDFTRSKFDLGNAHQLSRIIESPR